MGIRERIKRKKEVKEVGKQGPVSTFFSNDQQNAMFYSDLDYDVEDRVLEDIIYADQICDSENSIPSTSEVKYESSFDCSYTPSTKCSNSDKSKSNSEDKTF